MNVVIVAEHASVRFGGEAIIPYHYFRLLRARRVPTWLVVHARTRDELTQLLPDQAPFMRFIPDTVAHRLLHRIGQCLPGGIAYWSTGVISRLLTQWLATRIVRRLDREHTIDIVHQPIPVSPKEPSILHRQPAPLIVGPLNGGMQYPPGFRDRQRGSERRFTAIARGMSRAVNLLCRGKARAAMVLVANERSRGALALPAASTANGRIVQLVENGVDLNLWKPREAPPPQDSPQPRDSSAPVKFAFVGRLVDWKGVDLLLRAMARIRDEAPVSLEIIGAGAMRRALEELAGELGVKEQVSFKGWLTQSQCAQQLRAADVFVLPSLFECGGAVVLEAMACGLPVIATNWGGPVDYVDERSAILIEPGGEEAFIQGLAAAMLRLARDPALRASMGQAARQRVEREFDWDRKVDRILQLYQRATSAAPAAATQPEHAELLPAGA
jgi:glycosyltransferase involved in cell wall biosynthesis